MQGQGIDRKAALPGRPRRSFAAVRAVLALVAALLVVALGAAPAVASPQVPSGDLVPPEGAYFGSILDWGSDSVADQTERIGAPSAIYQREVGYPLTDADRRYLEGFFRQTAVAGSIAVVALRPTVALETLGSGDAEAFVEALNEIALPSGAPFYLSFAPDMNTTWVP